MNGYNLMACLCKTELSSAAQMGLVSATRSNFCIRSNNTNLLSQPFALSLVYALMQSFETISNRAYMCSKL